MFMIEFDMRQAAGFDDSPQNAQNAAKDNLEMLNYLTQMNGSSRGTQRAVSHSAGQAVATKLIGKTGCREWLLLDQCPARKST